VDDSALAEAYRAYAAAIWRRCRTLLRNDAAALDVTQQVFVRCLEHQRELRAGRELLAWLYRVATNLCLNHLRDQKTRGEGGDDDVANDNADEGVVLARGPGDPTTRLTIRQILRSLDERSQALAIYVFVDGMTHVEAAEVAGVSERTVRNCLGRFLDRGRAALELREEP
jgi:RNA polymerase sigma-70 factor (ECF subfamily)